MAQDWCVRSHCGERKIQLSSNLLYEFYRIIWNRNPIRITFCNKRNPDPILIRWNSILANKRAKLRAIRQLAEVKTYYGITRFSLLPNFQRKRYLEIAVPFDWTTKKGWLDFENGPNNLTQQILRDGKKIFVVEADRIRAPEEWPVTTYRGNLHNVLVHDRGARDWHDL